MKTTRLEFVQGALGFCAAGLLVAACGGEDEADPGGNGGTGSTTACGATIATNHGHKIRVTSAEAMAGAAKTYDIQGDSMHGHSLSITAAQFTELEAGGAITVTSSSDAGHTHDVTIAC